MVENLSAPHRHRADELHHRRRRATRATMTMCTFLLEMRSTTAGEMEIPTGAPAQDELATG